MSTAASSVQAVWMNPFVKSDRATGECYFYMGGSVAMGSYPKLMVYCSGQSNQKMDDDLGAHIKIYHRMIPSVVLFMDILWVYSNGNIYQYW